MYAAQNIKVKKCESSNFLSRSILEIKIQLIKEERVTAVYNTKILARFFLRESTDIIEIHKTSIKSTFITPFFSSQTCLKRT
jgi:hypothetical protein